jgi:tRNA U34 5-methylaminomethyl-2-thiouridine-forming methyltransferase MnmC
MDAKLREAKLAKLIENEGYDTLEEMAEAIFFRQHLASNLCRSGLRLHDRDGAGSRRRLLRSVREEHCA